MKTINQFLKPLTLVYGLLGVASVMCLVRFALRLLAADELSPVGKALVRVGSYLTGPFETLTHFKPVGQLPGSTFEPAALAGSLGYLVIGLVVALVVGSWRGWTAREVRQDHH